MVDIRRAQEEVAKEYAGRRMDEFIAPLVRALLQIGVPTASSCQGHIGIGHTPHPFVLLGFWDDTTKEPPAEVLQRLILLLGWWNGGQEPMIARTKWTLLPRFVRQRDGAIHISLFLQPENTNLHLSNETLHYLQVSAEDLARFLIENNENYEL